MGANFYNIPYNIPLYCFISFVYLLSYTVFKGGDFLVYLYFIYAFILTALLCLFSYMII